jgi:hypothetical protein
MKYIYIIPVVLLAACQNTNTVDFKPYTQEKTVFLSSEEKENSPQVKISLNLLEISGNKNLQECVYGVLYEGSTPNAYGDKIIATLKSQYRDIPALEEEIFDTESASSKWEYIETITETISKRIVQIARERYEFTGGAHGNPTRQYYVIDKNVENSKQVILNDIIRPDGETALLRAIEASLRVDAGIAPDAGLSENGFFEDSIKMPSYFFFKPEGIAFHWNPYEIAPYSRGFVETTVPSALVKDILTDYGKELSGN